MKRKISHMKTVNVFILCIVVVLAIFIIFNFVFHSFDYDRQSSIIGDRVCGSLDFGARDLCCAKAHADDLLNCEGSWKYDDKCVFSCFTQAELDEKKCAVAEGVWREFGNGCVDSCSVVRNPESGCTQTLTFGCDCGKDRCWNGETCEDN